MTLSAGTRLGPYEILSPLGAGGMGEVYRARDEKLDRDVAIKVLPESVAADPESLARFEREAKAVAALSHQNILSIFDFGNQAGTVYAVMELLEGETLGTRLLEGPIPQRQAVDYAIQIARGLSAAHEKGIVHRDLKPENLFVSKDGHVKILDFGLVKRISPSAPGEETSAPTISGHTVPGTVLGTVGYMSPEQVRGLAADHRSDIFSFGAILYELLTRKKAFKRDTAGDTMAAILRDPPADLSRSGIAVSPALDRILMHCLEKDRDNRFQTARDVVFALSEQPASDADTRTRPQRGPGTRRSVFVAAVVAAALAVAAVVLVRWPRGSLHDSGIKRVAVLPFENLGSSDDDYFADGIADEIRSKLASLPGVEVIARGSSTPYKKTSKTPQEVARELDAQYLLTATLRWEKSGVSGRLHVTPELVEVRGTRAPSSKWRRSFDAATADVFQVQSNIATDVAQALGSALGASDERRLAAKPTQDLAAYDAYLKGEAASMGMSTNEPPRVRKALGFFEQAVAMDPGFAQAWASLSWANASLYFNGTPTAELSQRSLQAAEKAVALAPDRAEGYTALGTYERLINGAHARALGYYEKGLRIAPRDDTLLRAKALAEQGLGRWDAAVQHFQEAERLDPRSVRNLSNLGQALLRLRRYPESREAYDRALALAPGNLDLVVGKVTSYLGQGDLAGARAVLGGVPADVEPTALVATLASVQDLVWVLDDGRRELLFRLTPSAFDDDRAIWAYCLAQAHALRGDVENRRRYAEDAAKGFEEQLRSAPDDAQLHAELGVARAYLGQKAEAVGEGQRAVALAPVSKDAFVGPYIQLQLVRVYLLVGEPEKALDQLEPLLKMTYYLSPDWLRIDPNFDPLRRNARFQALVAGGK
jgi:serine/threonine protein kinase/tetratricopeptide (TPR) repeat protein